MIHRHFQQTSAALQQASKEGGTTRVTPVKGPTVSAFKGCGPQFMWRSDAIEAAGQGVVSRKPRADGVVSRITTRRTQGLSEDAVGNPTGPSGRAVSVVRFRAANNIEYEIDADEVPLEVGRTVPVTYDPAQPSGGRAIERTPKVAIPIVLVLIGAALAFAAALRDE